jgi:hypothetical protein
MGLCVLPVTTPGLRRHAQPPRAQAKAAQHLEARARVPTGMELGRDDQSRQPRPDASSSTRTTTASQWLTRPSLCAPGARAPVVWQRLHKSSLACPSEEPNQARAGRVARRDALRNLRGQLGRAVNGAGEWKTVSLWPRRSEWDGRRTGQRPFRRGRGIRDIEICVII